MKHRRRQPAARKPVPSAQAPQRVLRIEKPIYGGNFLARDQGKAVFVPLALPGEQVQVRLVEQKKAYAVAELEGIAASAPERTAPSCPYFGRCGGCQYQHAHYSAQLGYKQAILRETLDRAHIPIPASIDVLAGDPWAYRNRIRLAFDGSGNPGYRSGGSHALIGIRECPIAAPLLVRAALAAADALRRLAPALRPGEIALFCDPDEKKLLVTLFLKAPAKAALCEELRQAIQTEIPQLTGLEMVQQSGEEEPSRLMAQSGSTSLTYRAAGFDYRVDHGAFFQVNRWLVDALVDRVTAGERGSLAWDLFAGVGLFARRLAGGFQRVVAVESSPVARQALAANLAGTAAEAVSSYALDFLRDNHGSAPPDLVVVDPPRTGLGPDLTQRLARLGPPSLVYVSCDPATLARDLRSLVDSGYALLSVTLADLFPQTFHLETVVHLRHS